MSEEPVLFRHEHEAMHTRFEIVIPETDADRDYASQAAMALFGEIERLEDELSRFRTSADIASIQKLKKGETMRLGLAALDCLSLAKAVHAATDGAFDITVGALMRIYRSQDGRLRLPQQEEEAWAHERVGMELFHIDEEQQTITVHTDNLIIDLGACGKGYALDQCVPLLADWGIKNALLNAGDSTLLGIGSAPDSNGWPVTAGNKVKQQVVLQNNALSGSGFHVKGAHIINPRTKRPVPPKADRVWALAPTAALSDAISTAFMVMKPEEVAAFCGQHPEVRAILD